MNMTINGVSLSDYGATLLSADYGYAKVTNYNDWLRGAKNPLYFGQDITYTIANYRMLVQSPDLHETDKRCSDICSAMSKAIVKVDNANWSIDGHITNTSEPNRISPLAREIEVSFEGVKIADRETLTKTLTFGTPWQVEAKGNQIVPCRIEIVLDMGYAGLELTVNDKKFKVNNIASNSSSLVIDSEKGLVTLDGTNKIEDYESWEMPYIKGGMNTISVNGAPTVKITYNGRWM